MTPTQPAATPTERALTAEEEAGLRRVIDKSIADDYHYHPLTVKMLLATLDALRAARAPEGATVKPFPVTDDDLDAPDGTVMTFRRVRGSWEPTPTGWEPERAARAEPGLREALGRIAAWSAHWKDESKSQLRGTMQLIHREAMAAYPTALDPAALEAHGEPPDLWTDQMIADVESDDRVRLAGGDPNAD